MDLPSSMLVLTDQGNVIIKVVTYKKTVGQIIMNSKLVKSELVMFHCNILYII
jgi:hypothetical protein